MLLQALEYRDLGASSVDEWLASAQQGLFTRTARDLAAAALDLTPLSWRTR